MAILAAMRKREAREVTEAIRRTMHNLRYQGQGAYSPRADAP